LRLRILFFGSFLFLLLISSCRAQSPTGTISGIVTDPTGATIAGAEVVAVNDATRAQFPGNTNDEGIYVISNLPPGSYRIQVAKVGFKTIIKPDILLNVQDALAINFALPLGAVSEIVTIQGGAPLVNTESAAVSTVVQRQFAENMPLNGRSFQNLIQLTPGVVLTPATYSSQGQFSVNGQRADANYFTVDGTSANAGSVAGIGLNSAAGGSLPAFSALGGTNSLVSVDAMQEFRIQTSSFAPEFGRTPGAQVSIVTRSGTNNFHGTVFDYFRNDALDANDWFGDRNLLAKPRERQNDFGGVLGGPVSKDRTFFFFSYEGLRLRLPQTQLSIVPNASSRGAAPIGVQPFLNAFPVANGADVGNGFAQFAAAFSNPATLDAYSLRIDHTINTKLTLFGRYNYSPSTVTQRGPSGVLSHTQTTRFVTHTLTAGVTALLSRRISNELRTNYSNVKAATVNHLDAFGGAVPAPDSVLFPTGFSSSTSLAGFVLGGAGTSSSGGIGFFTVGTNATNEARQINVVDSVSIIAGTHQVRMGIDYRWLAPISDPPAYQLQLAGFTGLSGSKGALSGMAPIALIRSFQGVTLLARNFSFYGQDVWKVTPRLTLTYGLRWDVNPTLSGKNDASAPRMVEGLDNPATMTLAPAGTPLYQTTYGNVAPRAGLAYQIKRSPRWQTVFHGGFGVFYDSTTGFLGTLVGSFPFSSTKILINVPLPLTAQQAAPLPIVATVPPSANLIVTEPQLQLPKTYQWNVSLEQSVGSNQMVSMTYLGAVGRDLLRANTLENPNSDFQQVVVIGNTATSDYHALQLKVQRRVNHGLQVLASYTLSHSLDISSSDSNASTTPASISPARIDRGNSDFDVRNSFSGALSYDVPFSSKSRISRAFLGGWSVDTLLIARTALPVDVIATTFVVNGDLYSVRPNVVAGVPFYLFGPQYPGGKALNGAAFTLPGANAQGNLSRNRLRGFGAWQDDFTVRRQFRISEKLNLQARADFFNVFNHPNFGNPANTLSSALFGESTQMLGKSLGSGGTNGGFSPLYQLGGPRSIQLALKMTF
jgi:hypothetical protein